MEEITLQVNGREMTFSEKELTSILEEHFKRKESEVEPKGPKEGEWFKVNPSSIDQRLFEHQRTDDSQELLRFYIQRAFEKMKENPEKKKPFKTFIPEKRYDNNIRVSELKDLARTIGDHMGCMWEWALMLAQRIANGESWESLCNVPDTANWYLLTEWHEHSRLVGGSRRSFYNPPSAHVDCYDYWDGDDVNNAVPLIVAYDD